MCYLSTCFTVVIQLKVGARPLLITDPRAAQMPVPNELSLTRQKSH